MHRDAADLFLGALDGVTDPEAKRKTIGRLFIEVFEEEAAKVGGADFLAQGTLYPDVIESVSFTGGPSRHHQVAPQCRRPAGADAHEAGRAAARTVQGRGARAGPRTGHSRRASSAAIRSPARVWRSASPARSRAKSCDLLRKADAIFLEEIRAAGLYDAIWQAFAVLLPVRTVGVMGDGRTYDSACALRAVTSTDGMTADVYPFDMAFLTRVANRIVNEVRGHQPGDLRHHQQAARDDRVGMILALPRVSHGYPIKRHNPLIKINKISQTPIGGYRGAEIRSDGTADGASTLLPVITIATTVMVTRASDGSFYRLADCKIHRFLIYGAPKMA